MTKNRLWATLHLDNVRMENDERTRRRIKRFKDLYMKMGGNEISDDEAKNLMLQSRKFNSGTLIGLMLLVIVLSVLILLVVSRFTN